MPGLGDDDEAGGGGVTSYPIRPYPSPRMSQFQPTVDEEVEEEDDDDDDEKEEEGGGCDESCDESCGAGVDTDVRL